MEKKNFYIKEYISGNWKYSIIFLFCFLLLGCVSAGIQTMTPFDFVFLVTKGFSYRKFRLVEFLYYLFFYIYPLFWINYFLENEKKDRNMAAKFRYGSVQRWNSVILKECIKYVLRYYAQFIYCLALIDTAFIMLRRDGREEYLFSIQEHYGVHMEGVYLGFVIALLWRLVELLLLLEIDLCIYQYAENTVAAFLGTFTIYLLGAILRPTNILIAGLSATYGALEIVGLHRIGILIFNIVAGLCLAFLLFMLQVKRTGKLRCIRWH